MSVQEEDHRERLTRSLTVLEMEAMKAWRHVYGRRWRAALWSAWMAHRYDGVADRHVQTLAYMRNSRGPLWLAQFRFISNGSKP